MKKAFALLLAALFVVMSVPTFALTLESATEATEAPAEVTEAAPKAAGEVIPGLNTLTGTTALVDFEDGDTHGTRYQDTNDEAYITDIGGDHGKVNANPVGVHLGDQWYLNYMFGNNLAAETGRPFTATLDFYSPAAMYNSGWGYNFGVAAGAATSLTITNRSTANAWHTASITFTPGASLPTTSANFGMHAYPKGDTYPDADAIRAAGPVYVDNVGIYNWYKATYHHRDGSATVEYADPFAGTYVPSAAITDHDYFVGDTTYKFLGWSTVENDTAAITAVSCNHEDIELYPVFEEIAGAPYILKFTDDADHKASATVYFGAYTVKNEDGVVYFTHKDSNQGAGRISFTESIDASSRPYLVMRVKVETKAVATHPKIYYITDADTGLNETKTFSDWSYYNAWPDEDGYYWMYLDISAKSGVATSKIKQFSMFAGLNAGETVGIEQIAFVADAQGYIASQYTAGPYVIDFENGLGTARGTGSGSALTVSTSNGVVTYSSTGGGYAGITMASPVPTTDFPYIILRMKTNAESKPGLGLYYKTTVEPGADEGKHLNRSSDFWKPYNRRGDGTRFELDADGYFWYYCKPSETSKGSHYTGDVTDIHMFAEWAAGDVVELERVVFAKDALAYIRDNFVAADVTLDFAGDYAANATLSSWGKMTQTMNGDFWQTTNTASGAAAAQVTVTKRLAIVPDDLPYIAFRRKESAPAKFHIYYVISGVNSGISETYTMNTNVFGTDAAGYTWDVGTSPNYKGGTLSNIQFNGQAAGASVNFAEIAFVKDPDAYINARMAEIEKEVYTPVTEDRYAIRVTKTPGLRFNAFVSAEQKADADEYGFVIGLADSFGGNYDDFVFADGYDSATAVAGTTPGGKKIVNGAAYIKSADKDLIYALDGAEGTGFYYTGVLVGMSSAEQYATNFAARSYIKVGEHTFYGDVRTASAYDVAKTGDTSDPVIANIIATVEGGGIEEGDV